MRKFVVELKRFIMMLFPLRWQKARLMAWLESITAPLRRIADELEAFRQANLYRLRHGPQVMHIEAVLNDKYDPALRRIYLIDGDGYEPLSIYRDAEGKQAPYIYLEAEGEPAPYLYTDNELNSVGIDFIIMIPATVVYETNELIALVDIYRLPGKVYIIQTF